MANIPNGRRPTQLPRQRPMLDLFISQTHTELAQASTQTELKGKDWPFLIVHTSPTKFR